jgi:hypothetical protein
MLVVEKGQAHVFSLFGVGKNGRNYHGTIIRATQRGFNAVWPVECGLTKGC